MDKLMETIKDVMISARTLVVYRRILQDPAVKKFIEMLDMSSNLNNEVVEKYHEFYSMLVEKTELEEKAGCGNLWQNHLLNLIISDENGFSLKCEASGVEGIDNALELLVKKDLTSLKKLYDFDFRTFSFILPELYDVSKKQGTAYPESYFSEVRYLKKILNHSADWTQNFNDIAAFYQKVGCGIMGRYWAFKWAKVGEHEDLVGITEPDPIRIKDLIGYEEQKREVMRNTEQFVSGFTANNMLLYGDRGTGKSSTIKALLHEYGERGLRMVEVPKYQIVHLPEIISRLRRRPQRFIIFIDDLSFEEYETEYKYLKAILEGSLEAAPKNVLIYATSNRRHLIRELAADRGENEWRDEDTIQEKMSLSDRFGITVVYMAPDQERYLDIVMGIAKNEGIEIEPEELRRLAVKWELWQNQKSGRTARQFIEDLKGKLGMKNK